MIRELSATGITADVSLFPNPGYKYRLLFVGIQLVTGTGTGNRYAYLQRQLPFSEIFANTGIQTATSSSFTAMGAISPDGGTALLVWQDYPEIDTKGGMQLIVLLIAGDTVNYTIIADEVIDA
jgi:hypothetical protein